MRIKKIVSWTWTAISYFLKYRGYNTVYYICDKKDKATAMMFAINEGEAQIAVEAFRNLFNSDLSVDEHGKLQPTSQV